ncbi:tRNA pseudouridine synthase B [Candidatus Endolissoclinum faulkneri L2]|uniref:tRNA pseudouridine synthase B n=1 Tax=Candidatus Endolissoclinum faulkneri L2 TaxID=1193729 RepID=K7Z2S9_9PROT|nr:tRNA pseudouridine(55) synthase TruB [Candidatus Endolissoclinum faulkneri]AFX98278.1 tRNA pseudouridine synthase B [Candidatus Endolissoclinum faulkneri L2]
MACKKRDGTVHGWLVLDKPMHITSAKAVFAVREIFNATKAGHAGTLDPLATGVLPIALGEATKTVPYAMNSTKDYNLTVRWGEATTTDDADGEVIETSELRPNIPDILEIIDRFIGIIEQVPPNFSAIRINGERAYKLARSGKKVNLKRRLINIINLILVNVPNRDEANFQVTSGSGAYMRSLARNLAQSLGTVGHVRNLRRLRVGPFCINNAITLNKIDNPMKNIQPSNYLLPIETALKNMPSIALQKSQAAILRNGQAIPIHTLMDNLRLYNLHENDLIYVTNNRIPVAITRIKNGDIHPLKVLNFSDTLKTIKQ